MTTPESPDVTAWFTTEVLWWRTIASLAWFWIASPCLLLALIACLSFSIAHPISFVIDSLLQVATLGFWARWMFSSLLFTVLGQWHMSMVSVEREVHSSPLAALVRLFIPVHRLFRHIAYATVSFMFGGISTLFVASSTSPVVNWYAPCDQEGSSGNACFSGDFMAYCINCSTVGFLYSVLSLANTEHCLTFPPFLQGRYFRVRAMLPACFMKSVVQALKINVFCFISYLVLGNTVFDYFRHLFAASWVNSPTGTLTLWSFSSTWQFFFTAVFLIFGHRLILQLFLIFNSQPMQFVVKSSLKADDQQLLSVALKSKHRMLQYLAYQDFCQVACDGSRRKPVFSLSPSGQPETWQNLSEECVLLLNTLTSTLQNAALGRKETKTAAVAGGVAGAAAKGMAATPAGVKPGTTPAPPSTGFVSKPGWPELPPSPDANIVVRRPVNVGAEMWSKSPVSRGVETISPQLVAAPTPAIAAKPPAPADNFKQNVRTVVTILAGFGRSLHKMLTRKVEPLTGQTVPASSSQLKLRVDYADSQKHIWAVEALCTLVVASYTEDQYGVVQKSFCTILNSLLDLLRAVEATLPTRPTFTGVGGVGVNVHPPSRTFFASIHPLQLTLVSTLQSGIYQIICTFRDHLHNFTLTPENQQRLTPFLNFWE